MCKKNRRLSSKWAGNLLTINAVFGFPGGRLVKIGLVRGIAESSGVGFLSDILVEDQIDVRTGLFNLRKGTQSARGKGIGSDLLAQFEHEMMTRGIGEIRGNLVPETPENLEWLIQWYQKRGYEYYPGDTAGAWAPPGTCGVVYKRLSARG